MKKIDPAALNDSQRKTYDHIYSSITELPKKYADKRAAVKFGMETAAETYIQTNTDEFFIREEMWRYAYPDRSPVLNLPLEVWTTDNFY